MREKKKRRKWREQEQKKKKKKNGPTRGKKIGEEKVVRDEKIGSKETRIRRMLGNFLNCDNDKAHNHYFLSYTNVLRRY